MRRLLAFILVLASVSLVLSQTTLSASTSVDPARGTTTTEPGVSPPASKTVVPEIPPGKKPNMETVKPSDSGSGTSSGTSGSASPQQPSPQQK